jgi:hypothetical protein
MNFRNKLICYDEEFFSPKPNPQAGGPPLFGRPLVRRGTHFSDNFPIQIGRK